jgi:hypothetical protein
LGLAKIIKEKVTIKKVEGMSKVKKDVQNAKCSSYGKGYGVLVADVY